jgi:hypothetical protein
MLNTVEPLTAFQLEVCGNRYTPQNVVVVVVIAGEVRPKFRRQLRAFRPCINFVTSQPYNAAKRMIYLLQKHYNASNIIAIHFYRLYASPTTIGCVAWVRDGPQAIGRGTPGSRA